MDSRHVESPAQAFDIAVLNEEGDIATRVDETGAEVWDERYWFDVAAVSDAAAERVGISVTAGAEWGWDAGHYERDRAEVPFQLPVAA